MNDTTIIIIDVRDYYAGDAQYPHGPRAHVTDSAIDDQYVLQHNQASGYYTQAEVIDDDLCYQSWLDRVDWDGCPSEDGSDHDANCVWAEDQLAKEGMYIVRCESGCLKLVKEI